MGNITPSIISQPFGRGLRYREPSARHLSFNRLKDGACLARGRRLQSQARGAKGGF